MDLNKIIKKVIKESYSKKLNEDNASNGGGLYFFSTMTGGVLAIPKDSEPEILGYVDVNSYYKKSKDIDWIVGVFGNRGKFSPSKYCKEEKPDMDLQLCLTAEFEIFYSKLNSGGVLTFSAILPETKKRETFNACWHRSEDNTKVLSMSESYLSGYFPIIDSNGACKGTPWKIDSIKAEKNEFDNTFKLEINLPFSN